MAVTRPTRGSLQASFERAVDERTDGAKPDGDDGGMAYEQGWKDGYDDGFASADDWLAQNEEEMLRHGWIRAAREVEFNEHRLTVQLHDWPDYIDVESTVNGDVRTYAPGPVEVGELVGSARQMERDLRQIVIEVRELSAAAYEIDGNAATVHNQRAELAKLNALRAEDAETIRRLRRELEEARHGDE